MFHNFVASLDDSRISAARNTNDFVLNFENLDLTNLDLIFFADSNIINNGRLNGKLAYTSGRHVELDARLDSLVLYNSMPLTVVGSALSNGSQVPFDFALTSESNKITLKGQYDLDNNDVDAYLLIDMDRLELLSFLVAGIIDEIKGGLNGEAKITGPITTPTFDGQLAFHDVGLTLKIHIPPSAFLRHHSARSVQAFYLILLQFLITVTTH